jgi:hypothetical protein
MKPASCKNKGRRLQLLVRSHILEAFHGKLLDDDIVNTSMGCGGEDLKFSPLARSCLPISIECKNTESLNIWSALSQASANCPENASPCVIFKRNKSDIYAVLPWKDLLQLYVNLNTRPVVTDEKMQRACELINELQELMK